MEKIFYVYEHWRPDKNVCFWVGKGKGDRAYHFKRNSYYNKVVAKLARLGLCVEVKIARGGLLEDAAHRLEIKRIQYWKERGIELTNITNGGEGTSGLKHTSEWKEAASKRLRGRKRSESEIEKTRLALKGRKQPESAKQQTAATLTTKWTDPAYRQRMVDSHIGYEPTEVARANMRASQVARRAREPVSAETRAKTSASITAWHAERRRQGKGANLCL
jgi:hypothetical protein